MMELSFLPVVVVIPPKHGFQIDLGTIAGLWSVLLLVAFVVMYVAEKTTGNF